MRPLRLLLLFTFVAPALCQPEGETYFSLTSTRTWGTKAKPSVQLNAWRVDELEFRVYRVNDPARFFEQLEDPHNFGMHTPRPPRARTWLERIRDWKHGTRAHIRRHLRAQTTEPPHQHLALLARNDAVAAPTATNDVQRFAATPVLNPQQLVMRFTLPTKSGDRWASQTVPVAVKEPGVYLVEAVNAENRAYTILMVSDLVMITKTSGSDVVNFVADSASGEPVRGVEVQMVSRGTRLDLKATTDASGIAQIKVPADHPEEVRLIAHSGANFAVNTLASYDFSSAREAWSGYIYTDRPVYRPGHTVHLRGILRNRVATGYNLPERKPVSVEVQDQEQKPVYKVSVTPSTTGTIHAEFDLPASVSLGSYSIEVHIADGAVLNGNFDVEEYKKPEYEVRVSTAKQRILQGERGEATIDARYYFGEPVAGAKVQYAVYRAPYYFPLWYEPDDDESPLDRSVDSGDNDFGDEQVLDEAGTLDADGKLTIHFDTTVSRRGTDYRYRVEARVTDEARREIAGRGGLIATFGSFVLNPRPERYFYPSGSKMTVNVDARDYDANPVRTRVHLQLLQYHWREPGRVDVHGSADLETNAEGTGAAELALPARGGSYVIRATARTPEGRDVSRDAWVWVAGGLGSDFDGPERKTVQIVPDKKSYRAGETAHVLMVAGRANTPVYVTIEGAALRSYRVVRSSDATATVDIPIRMEDEPGLYLTATYLREGEMYTASKYIKAPPDDHRMNVTITTDKPQYLPGAKAQYTIDAKDASGRPVPNAEFSLGVVDEAIYAIRRDTMPDPLSFFFGHEWNRVRTSDSMNYYFMGEAGKRRMQLAQLRPPTRLAQLKPERLAQPKVRKAFPDTAFWAADLTTDDSGRARARVDFPDSLTTWRATARGITAASKTGAATLKTIVRKNVIVRLAVPRFFMQGDEVTIAALVHNYLPNAKTARVSLDVAGLDVIDGGTKDVAVPSRGETRVEWRVRAQQVRKAVLTAKALTDEESDALELTLPINIPGVKLGEARGGVATPGETPTFDLSFPAKVQPGSRLLTVRVSPSIAGSLFSAVEYLTSFPYGCVEQTMSSFLPNVIVTKAVSDLGIKADLQGAEVQQKIRAGLDRLYNFHHEDGGWGWWETDESHPFMTAYVVAGLRQAKAAGVQVEQEHIDRGSEWVRIALKNDGKLAPDLRAYMAYAVPEQGTIATAYDQRKSMSPYGLALLGLAMESVGDARAAEFAAPVEQSAQQDGTQAWWPTSRDPMLDFSDDVTAEASAFAVKFLSHQRPQSPVLPKAVLWLMNHRSEGWWWSSTKQTAMVIYGLTDYLKATNELHPDLTATVYVNDQLVLTKKFDAAGGIDAPEFQLDESKLRMGANRVRVTVTGTGRLYYSARAEYFSTEERLERTGTVGLGMTRDYFRLVPGKSSDKIVYDLSPLSGPAAPGDVIAVRLGTTGTEWRYVMIEDPIPAGTEFIARDGDYELRSKPTWWESYFTRREMHDDRMAIFQTYLSSGQHQYFYLLKVVNPGVFRVSPARIGPMYQPGVMATTESRTLEVK